MTSKEFIAWAQGYYGNYPEGQKKDIWQYIKNLSQDYLDALKDVLMRTHESQWGRPPDIAIMERCYPEAKQIMDRPKLSTLLEEPDREEVYASFKEFKPEAQSLGINTEKDGWIVRTIIELSKKHTTPGVTS